MKEASMNITLINGEVISFKLKKRNDHFSLSMTPYDCSYFSLSEEDRAMVDKVKSFLLSL